MGVLSVVKKLVRCPNSDIGLLGHDIHHLECSQLQPVVMSGYQVDGVSGIYLPEGYENPLGLFKNSPKYPGEFDECRVALHQWYSYRRVPKYWVATNARLIWYFLWLNSRGENPFRVVRDHLNSY